MADELKQLGQTALVGGHFTDGQAKDENFRNISNVWTAQCITFDEGKQQLALDQQKIKDIKSPLSDWQAVVTEDDAFALRHKPSGRDYRPTEKAVKDIAVIGFTSEWFLSDLLGDKKKNDAKGNEKLVFKRDRRDAELLAHTVNLMLFAPDRIDQKKVRLFRTWDDGTLRALLSEQYAIVNNLWYLETLEKLIPGGLLSHWRGDADTIFGNVLIPDSVRQETDSQYGGMLSVGNSEIGLRRILSMPSVFRAICMNGCIWDQEKGVAVSQVHRGSIDYKALETQIAKNLQAQIPLLSEGITKLLGSRLLKMGDVPTVNVVAQFFKDFSVPKSQSPKFFGHWKTESEILGGEIRTAFGLQAAVTRLGQELSNDDWVKYDQIGGKVANLTPDRWGGMLNRAKTLDKTDIEKALGDVTHLIG